MVEGAIAVSEDVAADPAEGDRLVLTKTVGIPERVILGVVGCVLLAVPWKLLIALDHPLSTPRLWLLVISLGAVTVAFAALVAAITGPKFVTVVDFDRGTLEQSMRGAFGFGRRRTATIHDIDRIEIQRFRIASANSISWRVLLILRAGLPDWAIASFGTPERAEAFADDIRDRIARRSAATIEIVLPPSDAG